MWLVLGMVAAIAVLLFAAMSARRARKRYAGSGDGAGAVVAGGLDGGHPCAPGDHGMSCSDGGGGDGGGGGGNGGGS